MLFDWFTVGAQALNFVILVWLMKRFLYHPVLDAIASRERHVAAALADAAAKQAQALQERDAFRQRNEAFDQQRAALLEQATRDAETERQRLLAEAREAADALREQRRQALRNNAQRLNQALLQRTQQEVFAITRQALSDLASAGLEERMVDVFVRRLHALDGPARTAFAQALAGATGAARVRSAFELPAALRATLQAAVDQAFPGGTALRFETAPELVGGIELGAGGHKLAWSIADYLASLQQGVAALTQPPGVAAGAAAAADPA